MNPIKQTMLYNEVVSMGPCATTKSSGVSISAHGNTQYNAVQIEHSGLFLLVSRIVKFTGNIENVSYKLSIKNNGALRHAPRIYSNESFLARAMYNHLMRRELCSTGFIKSYIR